MWIIDFSEYAPINRDSSLFPQDTEIHVFTQFFIHSLTNRHKEICACLHNNIRNPFITKIHLLNERIYSNKEMYLAKTQEKIIQTDIKKRLSYQDVITYIFKNKIRGFLILCNSDIFFDSTLERLKFTNLHDPSKKTMMALLRYNVSTPGTETAKIFDNRSDSQDTWIFHSNTFLESTHLKSDVFNFHFGLPGCDNKFLYLLRIMGYHIINDPIFLKTYHFHMTNIRNYTDKDKLPPPYCLVVPAGFKVCLATGMTKEKIEKENIVFGQENKRLYEYILSKWKENKPFLIPRIAWTETLIAILAMNCKKRREVPAEWRNMISDIIQKGKANAGIKISSMDSMIRYSEAYLESFELSEMYGGWEEWGYYRKSVADQYDYIIQNYPREMIWSSVYDIFHYIHGPDPIWSFALEGKRVLFITSVADSIQEKIDHRKDIYGVDLFPNCTILTIKPPFTHGNNPSQEFNLELDAFYQRLDNLSGQYDIALVAAGGYGNLICSYIYKNHHKSAIYVGGILQMYWGILGKRWINDRPDIIKMFVNNDHWTYPKESEKPDGYQKIENACYW